RGGASRLGGDPVEFFAAEAAEDRGIRQGWQRQRGHPVGIGVNEGLLASIPLREQLGRRRGPHQSGVHDAGVGDSGHVSRRGDTTLEVPYHLVGIGEVLSEESAAIARCEYPGVAPTLAGQRPRVLLRNRTDVENVNDEYVGGLGGLHRG